MNTSDLYDESIDLATRLDNAAETIGQLQTELTKTRREIARLNQLRSRGRVRDAAIEECVKDWEANHPGIGVADFSARFRALKSKPVGGV